MNTLQGEVFTVDVGGIETVQQLQAMLAEHFPGDDPIDKKILRVDVLRDRCLLDGAQTLHAAGLHAESEVTVIYGRHEIQAARKEQVQTEKFCQVNIPQAVREVSRLAFDGCRQVVKVTIPDGVTSIGVCAFYGCSSLESITIPDSVQEIGNAAFLGCTSLKSITIPNWVTRIGKMTFQDCKSLESITLPDWLKEMESQSFQGCKSLKSITIPIG